VIRPGEIQFMRAGTGVTHSEANASKTEPVHFLQIWIVPDARGLAPTYDQKQVDEAKARSGFALVASRDGREGSVQVHQDVELFVVKLGPAEARTRTLDPSRHAFVHLARGEASVNGETLAAGDGAFLDDTPSLKIEGVSEAELLVFDLG
jgi:redox-sensitive bicupin YhaK (pirin superfamily)